MHQNLLAWELNDTGKGNAFPRELFFYADISSDNNAIWFIKIVNFTDENDYIVRNSSNDYWSRI